MEEKVEVNSGAIKNKSNHYFNQFIIKILQ